MNLRLNCLFLMSFLVASPALADELTNVTEAPVVRNVRASEILMPREIEEQRAATYNWVERFTLHKSHGFAFQFTEFERGRLPSIEFDVLGPFIGKKPGLGFAIRF